MFSLRGGAAASGANAAPAPESSHPKFPGYLLPTFAIPFRRRRQSSSATAASHGVGSPPGDHAVPSLSSTPTDSALSSPVESPPTPTLVPAALSAKGKDYRALTEHPHDVTRLAQTQPDTIRCGGCAADFAFSSQIVSKGFTGRYGRAYLVSPPDRSHQPEQPLATLPSAGRDLVNIRVGKPETRLLVTGSHIVADITCATCNAKVGWKYVDANEESQKYKVGKFILETQRCIVHRSWEDVPPEDLPTVEARRRDPLFAPSPPSPSGASVADVIVFDSEDEDECEDLFCGTWNPELAAIRRSRKVNQRSRRG